MSAEVKPVLQALLVADHIYTDATTQKKIVAGIFHQLNYIRKDVFNAEVERREGKIPLPAGGFQSGTPFAYASLTSVRGKQDFILRYVDLADEKVIFQIEWSINCHDPLSSVEFALPLPALPTTKPGVFALELLWGKDDPLGSFRITVKEIEMG